jgi:hypothetical protein
MGAMKGFRGGALLALGLVACGGGGSDGGGPGNTVTVLASTCPSGAGGVPNTSCLLLLVETANNPPAEVELRITEPNPGVPYVGTAVVNSGESGNEFFAKLTGGPELIRDLSDLGLRVVDRRWPDGWMTSSFELRPQSARLGALLDWIAAQEVQGGLFFAVGNSGGAGEIAYTLTAWGKADLFDAVVLGAGPPFSRLDYLCRPPTAAWSAQCPAFAPPLECGIPNCTGQAENALCNYLPATLTPAELENDSILFPGADLSFGNLPVHVLIGAEDCSDWVPQALLFQGSVASTLQIIPDTPHTITATPQGRDAIIQALLGFTPFAATAEDVQRLGLALWLIEDGEARASVSGTAVVRDER